MSDSFKLSFDFNWKLTISVVLLLPLLVNLSLWQLDRAEEKKQLQLLFEKKQSLSPQGFDSAKVYQDFERVRTAGLFDQSKYWLQENQFANGQLGYNVIMPFNTVNGALIAVDRGWVEGSPLRDYVPDINTPSEEIVITGTFVTPSDSKLIREAETSAKSWPHKILEIDLKVMSSQSEKKIYKKLLRLDADNPAAFVVDWKPANMSSAKHYGYAVQWALMSIALIIMFVFASTNLSDKFQRKNA